MKHSYIIIREMKSSYIYINILKQLINIYRALLTYFSQDFVDRWALWTNSTLHDVCDELQARASERLKTTNVYTDRMHSLIHGSQLSFRLERGEYLMTGELPIKLSVDIDFVQKGINTAIGTNCANCARERSRSTNWSPVQNIERIHSA